MGAWFDKPAEIPRNETAAFKYTVELNIKYKDGHGNVQDIDPVKFRLTKAVDSTHQYIHGLGCSSAQIPGQDPRAIAYKECQDSTLITESHGKLLVGVFDGHGKHGKLVSQFWVNHLQKQFPSYLEKFEQDPISALTELVLETDTKLKLQMTIDSTISGTTAVVVYFDFINIYVANVGDSRCVLGTVCNPEMLNSEDLHKIKHRGGKLIESRRMTRDHKPTDQGEQERIEQHGGTVHPLKNETGEFIGPPRVWKQDWEYPGLAMSRSIGDKVGADVGVISVPTIEKFPYLKDQHEFLVLGSDGLWDAMASIEAVNFIEKYRKQCSINQSKAHEMTCSKPENTPIAQFACEYARKNWFGIVCEEDVLIDDIGCVIVEFNGKERPEVSCSKYELQQEKSQEQVKEVKMMPDNTYDGTKFTERRGQNRLTAVYKLE